MELVSLNPQPISLIERFGNIKNEWTIDKTMNWIGTKSELKEKISKFGPGYKTMLETLFDEWQIEINVNKKQILASQITALIFVLYYKTRLRINKKPGFSMKVQSALTDNDENKYFLRDYDPDTDFESAQKYFSNEKFLVDAYKGTELLNNSANVAQNEEFLISNKEIYIYKTNGNGEYLNDSGAVLADQNNPALRIIKERKLPGIWLDLKKSFFQQKILDAAASGVLYNNNVFKNYFRGLLFEVEAISPDQGALAMLDFSSAEIKIIYKASNVAPTPEAPSPTRTRKVYGLHMGYKSSTAKRANCINFIEHTKSANYQDKVQSSDQLNDDDRLYIKGGNGSIAFLDVFGPDVKKAVNGIMVSEPTGNGIPDELEELRINMKANRWLVNEANLVFYVDQNTLSNANQKEPERIYIFDATNHKPILDYNADNSNGTTPKKNKGAFGGLIERETVALPNGNKKGIKYKIRLTEYIRQLIKNENTNYDDNVRIGVAVIEDINSPANASINPANPITIGTSQVPFIPVSTVMSPLGTVLYGTKIPASDPNVAKKIKIRNIFYQT